MSVIVCGMEMPEHCGYCRFRYDGICHALQKTQYSMEECPLVPVSPHGDLIDRDETMNAILEERGEDTACWFAEIVNEMPTIIEAEEEE